MQRGADPRVDRAEELAEAGGVGFDLPRDERPVEKHECETSDLPANAARARRLAEPDGALQRRGDLVYRAPPHATRRLEDRRVALATLQREHEQETEEFGTRLEHSRQRVESRKAGRRRRGGECRKKGVSCALHHGRKQAFLAAEGPIDRGRTDVCHAADLRDRGGRIALLGQQRSRDAQNRLSSLRSFEMAPRLGHGKQS